MNRVSLAIALVAAGAACSEPTNLAPTQLNLDRPVDIAFGCYGPMRVASGPTKGDVVFTAQPALSCEKRSEQPIVSSDPAVPPKLQVPPGQEDVPITVWYGFILQSATGTVAIAHWPVGEAKSFNPGTIVVADADSLTPGKNSISVGEEPIAIATDKTGCFEVTANAGSCDLSTLDITSAVDDDPSTPVQVNRVPVIDDLGNPVLARPAAMVAQPNTQDVGNLCGATPSGLMYIAYPSCNMVAAVDSATGKVTAHIDYNTMTGAISITPGGSVSCPMECTGETVKPKPINNGPRPVALSLDVSTRRLAIGAEGVASVAVVDLDENFLPNGTFVQVPLEHGMNDGFGITALALSPVIGMGGNREGRLDDDQTPGGKGQYVYAVATDGTVRVADVHNTPARECDTQIDGRFLRAISDVPTLQCLPIKDPTLPRRSGVKGPGIELTGDTVPLSVAFFKVDRITDAMGNPTPRPQSSFMPPTPLDDPKTVLVGYFAIVTATNGASYVVNVDDDDVFDRFSITADRFSPNDPLGTQPTLVIPHQLRDSARYRGATAIPVPSTQTMLTDDRGQDAPACGDLSPPVDIGGPRATAEPARNLNGGPVAASKAGELPSLRSVTCVDTKDASGNSKTPPTVPVSELAFPAPVDTRTEVFPDLRTVRVDEQWSLAWEGALSLDTGISAIDGPVVRTGRTRVDATGLHLIDPSKPFCEIGVEPFDYVQLRGCNPTSNSDCPVGYQCFLHPESQLGIGACLLTNEAERLANLCRDFLISGRRYTVNNDPHSGDLVLLPRKHVLRTTPVDGCVDDNQCTLLANYAAYARTDKDPTASPVVQPVPDPEGKLKDVNGHQWQCRLDEARAQVNTDPARNRRCMQVCATNDDCNVEDDELNRRFNIPQFKMVCQSGVCMEGIAPPQQCINGPQHYDVHASEAFAVIGTRSGYVHPITEMAGRCVRNEAPSSLQIGRIPLTAPACDPTADPITGQLPGGGFDRNPCAKTAVQSELPPVINPTPATCTTTPADPKTTAAVERQAPAIQFRNRSMKLTLVDPYYPGDGPCILDRAGQLGNIPLVYQGYQIAFHQGSGFAPMILNSIIPAFPVKVVQGPTQSIWILDEGDFLSATQASTRGKVWRVESINTGTFGVLQ